MRIAARPWLAISALLCACGSDETAPPAPPGKVTLRVTSLIPVGTPAWHETSPDDPGDPPQLTLGCDRSLAVGLEIVNYSLRAPNSCGGSLQCGYDQVTLLRADGSVALGPIQSASTAVLLDLSGLEPLVGDYVVHPELLNTDGTPFTDNFASEPEDLSMTIATDACPEGEGGAGGEGSGGGEAGGAGVTGG